MDAHIGKLRWQYRLPRAGTPVPSSSSTDVLLDTYESALQTALDGDPSVWIIRRVGARLVARAAEFNSQTVQATIARRLAASVFHTMAREAHDPDQVMRFENQAEFVAAFLEDLILARAWSCWYYVPFRKFEGQSLHDVVAAVLLDNVADLPAIFAKLRRRGILKRILLLLGGVAPVLLRQMRHPVALAASASGWCPLVSIARRVLVLAGCCRDEELPSEGISVEWITSQGWTAPDWNSPRSLAEAVFNICVVLALRVPELTLARTAQLASALDAISEAELVDWLDWPWLKGRLAAELPEISKTSPVILAPRPPTEFTPAQAELIELLARLKSDGTIVLSPELGPPEQTLAVLATVCDVDARWMGSAMAISVIESWLQSGNLVAVPRPRSARAGALHRTARARDLRPELAARVLETHESFSTSHAGLFLLIRALRDVRVPIIVADEKVRQLLLLKLARIWAQGIAPDAGLVFWCGYPLGLTLPEDAELDNLEAQRVFRDIVGVLIRQRVPGIDSADSESPNMSLLAGWILRAWARWIHGFAKSSTDFLLDSFVRRPGRLSILRDSIVVEIGPRPLDVVLEIAGYLDPVERVEWLSNRKVIFIRSPI